MPRRFGMSGAGACLQWTAYSTPTISPVRYALCAPPRRGRRGQLARHAEGAPDEQSLELIAAIDPSEASLGQARQRPGPMGKHAIERVDGQAHHARFRLPPALIPTQHAQSPRVLTLAAGDSEQLGEGRGI